MRDVMKGKVIGWAGSVFDGAHIFEEQRMEAF